MKVKALTEHMCYCCGGVIKRGDECIAFIVSPENPEKTEFDVIYTCLKCSLEESCKIKVQKRTGH